MSSSGLVVVEITELISIVVHSISIYNPFDEEEVDRDISDAI